MCVPPSLPLPTPHTQKQQEINKTLMGPLHHPKRRIITFGVWVFISLLPLPLPPPFFFLTLLAPTHPHPHPPPAQWCPRCCAAHTIHLTPNHHPFYVQIFPYPPFRFLPPFLHFHFFPPSLRCLRGPLLTIPPPPPPSPPPHHHWATEPTHPRMASDAELSWMTTIHPLFINSTTKPTSVFFRFLLFFWRFFGKWVDTSGMLGCVCGEVHRAPNVGTR